ncbi:splicing factor, Prp19-binding domain-containing protein [Ephemerocybe angulata]|uniref:Splicing factor, Prp19-binding domain-containing protein n=1 Tax=Ephemerocybe angulata TaxID=980116 RepID=A0A8H6IJ12_9AGAR|nr:splicing factor, Prp19-binding domain-containing protein [Tulosesus angulatus]
MSLATTVPRKQAARLAKPATRYWKGKAPQGLAEVQSDSDEEDEERDDAGEDIALDEREEEDEEEEGMTLHKGIEKTKAMNIALKDVSITNDGKVRVAGRDESGRTALEHAANADNDVEVADEDESEDDEESEEESSEEDSSEDEKPKVQFRPVFVPKRARVTVAEREKLAEDTEEALKRKEEEALQRKKESHDLVAESIKRELAEKEKEDDVPDVDDTDGLDPEGEFEAWRLRELGRIKKEKEAELEREQEREEIERRRALPEEQRLKEDMERAKQTRDEKPKGSQKFLQKYWHKGAFHQDMEVLKRHDYTEATESTVDVSVLPKLMQVRNFGKRSRTKYTHLLDQDTTASTGGFGGTGPVKAGGTSAQGGGCFLCGGPHLKKDCPQLAEHTSGANNRPLGQRSQQPRDEHRDGGWSRKDDRNDDGPRERDRDRGDRRGYDDRERRYTSQQDRYEDKHYSRGGRSRSRSPYRPYRPAERDSDRDRHRRPRSRSREHPDERDYKDKRRPPMSPTERTVKVAIVGSGLAGLTAGYLLTEPVESEKGKERGHIEVHLFEKSPTLGMDAASVSIPVAKSAGDWRIDVPMRSFQGGYYPNVIALYEKLGVSFRKANFSYSFSFMSQPKERDNRSVTTTMIYNGSSGSAGVSKPTILGGVPQQKGQNYLLYLLGKLWGTGLFILLTMQIAVCFAMTIWHSIPVRRPQKLSTMTLGEWVQEVAPTGEIARLTGMDVAWGDYVETILLPLMSAMTTAPEDDVMNHPVEEILDYCWLTLGTSHYVVSNGVRDVVSRLSRNLQNVHLSSSIISIRPDPQDSRLISLDGFHHLVFATQASSAIPLLGSYMSNLPSSAESQRMAIMDQIRCLKAFKYRSTIDACDEGLYRPGYPSHLPDVYQTTNPFVSPRKDTIISVSSLERAVLDCEAKEALKGLCKVKKQSVCGLGSVQGAGRLTDGCPGVWISGSYAYLGVPLLEGCVVSARNVVEEGILKTEGLKLRREPWSI